MVAVRVGEPRWVAILATRSVYGPTISAAEYNTVRLLSVSLNIPFAQSNPIHKGEARQTGIIGA